MLEALVHVASHIAAAHDRWRASLGRRPLSGEVARLEERVSKLEAENELLRQRVLRVPARRRPYYKPWERLEILWHRARYRMSIDATARAFALNRNTILNWERALERKQYRTVGPRRPLHAVTELVSELAERIKLDWPEWGSRRIAGVLAKLGILTSRSTVQRVLRRGPRRPATAEGTARPPVTAAGPNDVWITDFTRLGNGFRGVWIRAVIDAFSRKVLALVVAPRGASARATLRMLRHAAREHGTPRWLISDKGPEFTAGSVSSWARRHDVGHRFGAVGRRGSVSLIERFWRTMKQEYARGLLLYRSKRVIENKLRIYARWFNEERPHQGIEQRTPDHAYFRRRRKSRRYFERGRIEVQLIGGDRRLPVLRLRDAA